MRLIVLPFLFFAGLAYAADEATLAERLEQQLRSGDITPEGAVAAYCAEESTDKQMDAFCACPDDAVELLRQRLGLITTHWKGDRNEV